MIWTRNVGRRRQTLRLRIGVVAFGTALVLGAGLAHVQPRALLHGFLFLLLFLATSSIAQGLSGTDALLALRGLRDMDDGPERIADASEALRVRRTARRVVAIAGGSAAVLTALLILASR